MRKAACTIYFRLHVLMNIVFYGITMYATDVRHTSDVRQTDVRRQTSDSISA